ncbi:MAG: hypothetical protein WCF67_17560, partial [Chitinophagaceae bacterium]
MRAFIIVLSALLTQPLFARQAPVNSASAQQADTSYHLLWYKGKKIKPNVLLTPKYDTVTYIPSKGRLKIVSKAGNGKAYDKMLAELNKTPQRMSEAMQLFAAKLPKSMVPYMAAPLAAAYSRIQDDFTGPLSNLIDLPLLKPAENSATRAEIQADDKINENVPVQQVALQQAPPDGGTITDWPIDKDGYIKLKPEDIKRIASVKEVLAYYERHKNEAINYVPAPPTNDYQYCNECDTAKETRWKRDFEVFRKELAGRDEYMMQQILGMMRQAQLLDIDGIQQEVMRLMIPVLDWLIDRADKRGRLLVEKYVEDPTRVRALCSIILGIDRHMQLLGMGQQDEFYANAFMRATKTIADLLERSIKEYDYGMALNMIAILSTD